MTAQIESVVSDFTTDNERWAAVVRRESAADSSFYYSVRTTGVFCRPSCGARLPLRENVQFHTTVADAERAGFRPCKRCQPGKPSLAERQAEIVATACQLIESAVVVPSLDDLSSTANMSKFHFQRVFKAVTGVTPKAYATAHRTRTIQRNVKSAASLTDAIYESGFGSSGPFYAATPAALGMTPSQFRDGAVGLQIRYSIGRCSLGLVLAAATRKGVCSILLGDDPQALVDDLKRRFSGADLISDDAGFQATLQAVIRLVEEPSSEFELPLDIRGTVFQHRVWLALRKVPAGSTATYLEIAEMIGLPSGSRAVSGACAANPLAIAVPCHRVVRKDGGLAGYRWGVERKRKLLERESTN